MPAEGVRDQLLATGVRLFAARGYDAVSVQEVVEAAGVTKGAFYHYFRSKDELLHEIYRWLLELQLARLEGFLTAAGPPDRRLHDAAVDVVMTSFAHRDEFTVFVRSMHRLDDANAAAVRTERRRYHDRFRSLVEQGQQAGALRADVDADVAVHTFLGAAHQIPEWFRPGGRLTVEQVAEQMVALLLDGLRGGRRRGSTD
ncbi:MAG TPA: TetR/AcrR family transcriptional regulator [Nocardioides sp.]|uniref:TetR/AcrR family transcriptional regulator n=1 Tax=Nocardioides sp. TaxID=35761 RepID=UPI002C3E331F|nr:TetR/AcrR family transcriptional regulator [Nocardioides sp.]HQR27779.1 TetR/AcrR family transcriptional regulator [Nocardioides sp.]